MAVSGGSTVLKRRGKIGIIYFTTITYLKDSIAIAGGQGKAREKLKKKLVEFEALTHLCRHVDHQQTVHLGVQSLQYLLRQGRLSSAHRTCEKDRSLSLKQIVHQEVVAYGVNCRDHDLVKWHALRKTNLEIN